LRKNFENHARIRCSPNLQNINQLGLALASRVAQDKKSRVRVLASFSQTTFFRGKELIVLNKAFVTLALGLALSAGASAATYELPSPLSPTPQGLGISVPQSGAFADVVNFRVAQNGIATFTATRERGRSGDFFVSVFNSDNHLVFGAYNYVLGSLQVGSYYATVSGFFKGKNNAYGFTALAAVPLPAAFWLLGGGLVGFLFVARRRSHSTP
jgi:hypothetical protein